MDKQVLGNLKKGLLFALSAPAGTGKTTLIRKLIRHHSEHIVQSISCTTRAPRPKEVNGKDYIFLTEKEFEKRKEQGDFIENVSLFGAHYGTLRETIETQRESGKHVICVIDTRGALALKEKEGARLIFLLPPSLDVLHERLHNRQTESQKSLNERFKRVRFELEQMQQFDYQIVNCDLDIAYEVLRSILIAEEHRLGHFKEKV